MLEPISCSLKRVGVSLLLGVSGLTAGGTGPYTAHAPQPAADLWMYPNTPTPGTRTTASTFSYLPFTGVDDRYGQFVVKFNTVAAGIPAGLGSSNYDIHRLVFTAVYASEESLPYDPTEDPRASLGSAPTIADPDAGRPLELHGTGFRGGFTATTFNETSPYGSRNAFASSFDAAGVARDVTNSITLGYESYPWAIGKISAPVDINANPVVYVPLLPGEVIPLYSHVTFEINLALPGVADYVRQGLHQGCLWFSLSSFHPVTGPGSSGFPAYFTLNHPEQALYGDVAPTLDAEFSLPLRVASFSRSAAGNTANLTWNGSPGFKYVVEGTSNLATGVWSPLGTFTTATPVTLTWSGNASLPRTFFRIARTSQP
ncbi:MAG: hypothetical protein ABIS50_26295 [Luteolibacter sp.]|uniref:hypothetical protein n=1 Tax=Luteolibacter sp. TaxID=1962973 RepID=UPI0032653173